MTHLQRELTGATWRKSSHSGSGDQCVEVAPLASGLRALRDSKDPAARPWCWSRRPGEASWTRSRRVSEHTAGGPRRATPRPLAWARPPSQKTRTSSSIGGASTTGG
ncbi:DUF397 domain-containing protein [Actinomadura madurae]|uniref:DUF397 domain-containing protein n=1 Tax=Actinomadura madurae TaxID=1993 RepID=UPI0027E22955|nr:DUF397 domain-containing protein [Actinomadura madurae]